ncbi:MAG: rhodanese-like domain-containing protein, partial [Bdellovibrionales bacterium]
MIKVTSFYDFFSIDKKSLPSIKNQLKNQGQLLNIRGLILIGTEGINSTLSGEESCLENYKTLLESLFKQSFSYKDSFCETWNFKQLSIKIKSEIIKIGKSYPHLQKENNHIDAEKWNHKIKNEAQILDVRNTYEVNLGKFKNAKDLQIENFQEFPSKIASAPLDKKKETLIYCTGGIRCEKAIEIMKEKGFQKVYQLNGGILEYLKQKSSRFFEGECFVFDHRVSIDKS